MSRLSSLGPRRMPTPQLPKPVPSPITGAGAKAAKLKYPLRREVTEPDEAGFAPVHSARVSPTRFPNTEPAVLSIAVIGKPDCRTDTPEICQRDRTGLTNEGPNRTFGVWYTALRTKRCVRSKSEGPCDPRGSV